MTGVQTCALPILVLSAMLAPASSGDAITRRACCDELLANTPAPQATAPTINAAHHDPAMASVIMPKLIEINDTFTFDVAPLTAMRRVAQTLPTTPAPPNNMSANDSVFGDALNVFATNGAM